MPLGHCIVAEIRCNWYLHDINIYSIKKRHPPSWWLHGRAWHVRWAWVVGRSVGQQGSVHLRWQGWPRRMGTMGVTPPRAQPCPETWAWRHTCVGGGRWGATWGGWDHLIWTEGVCMFHWLFIQIISFLHKFTVNIMIILCVFLRSFCPFYFFILILWVPNFSYSPFLALIFHSFRKNLDGVTSRAHQTNLWEPK
jgi:hypothetical protein